MMNGSLLEKYVLDRIPRLQRNPDAHKGDAGKVLIIGGALGMTGAILLAGKASVYLGAGWTVLEMIDVESAKNATFLPELMVHHACPARVDKILTEPPNALAIGPGLGNSTLSQTYLKAILTSYHGPIILDADALNLIAQSGELFEHLLTRNLNNPMMSVITPHPGEAARLLKTNVSDVQNNRTAAIAQLVKKTQSIVVLKGHHTLIASPIHPNFTCSAGNPGMATGGMGDVLTGSIAAITSQGIRHNLNLWESVCIATFVHALAADRLVAKGVGPIGLTPSETIVEMRSLLNQYL